MLSLQGPSFLFGPPPPGSPQCRRPDKISSSPNGEPSPSVILPRTPHIVFFTAAFRLYPFLRIVLWQCPLIPLSTSSASSHYREAINNVSKLKLAVCYIQLLLILCIHQLLNAFRYCSCRSVNSVHSSTPRVCALYTFVSHPESLWRGALDSAHYRPPTCIDCL